MNSAELIEKLKEVKESIIKIEQEKTVFGPPKVKKIGSMKTVRKKDKDLK